MPKLSNANPKYRRHSTGQAVVTLAGRDFYLGVYGTPESRREYQRLLAEWHAAGRNLPPSYADPGRTLAEVMLAYLNFAEGYYLSGGELAGIKCALKAVRELYADLPAADFSPLKLKAVREKLIDRKISRGVINQWIGRIKRMIRWATENELVPGSVYHALQAVRGLQRGRSEARETDPVKPVPAPFVDAVKPFVAPQIWAMIELQRLTGMRPGEVTILRTADLDTSGAIWVYTPLRHKTQHRGHARQIYLGPQAQGVLRPWLKTDLEAYLFSPREAMESHHAERGRNRKTPAGYGNGPGTNRKRRPQIAPREFYQVGAYGRAIARACEKANVPHWHPHQLRHNAATFLRKEFGLDTARAVLGHRSPAITEVYAEVDGEKARQVMQRVG